MKTLAMFVLAAGGSTKVLAMDCAPTPQAAIQRLLTGRSVDGTAEGYRVASVHVDTLRRRAWAFVGQCGRNEVPVVAVLLSIDAGALDLPVAHRPVVHVGDEVTVIARTSSSRTVLHGWAEESGAVASKIRVRLPKLSEDGIAPAPTIECRVTHAGAAEVVQ